MTLLKQLLALKEGQLEHDGEEDKSILTIMGKQTRVHDGNFNCGYLNEITSLEGGPSIILGDFDCSGNKLTSLEYGPTSVLRHYNCGDNKIVTLRGAPAAITGNFYCSGNKLTSLEHCPTLVGGNFYCSNNNLISLNWAPIHISGDFYCNNNSNLKSLKDIHRRIKSIDRKFHAVNCPLIENLLGLILIDGIKDILIDNKKIQAILNKYLLQPNKKLAMLKCQQELIEAGFEEAAQL